MAERNEVAGQKTIDFKIELAAVFAILVSLGFPGNLEMVYGESFGISMEYAAFFLEIMVMLFSSGKSWMDIRVVNLEKKYAVLYLFAGIIFVTSMLATRYPSLQAVTCTRLVVTLFFAIWLQERFRLERLVELFCMAQAIFIVLTLFTAVLLPELVFESGETYIDAFRGLYSTKNTCAAELVFGIIVMAVQIREKRRNWENYRLWVILWAIQIILLLLCQATGALFCLILVLFLFLVPSHIRVPVGWIYVIGNVVFLFAVLTLMPAFEWFFEAIGKDATLTGRIPLWNRIIEVMLDNRTFLGFGYGMFWRDPRAYALIHMAFDENSFLGTMTTGAHNVLMEFWLNSGLVGLAALFGTILWSLRAVQRFSEKEYLFCTVIMSYLMINGFTERCLGGNYEYKTLAFLTILAFGCQRGENIAENR